MNSRYDVDIFIRWKNTAYHASNWYEVQQGTGEVAHYAKSGIRTKDLIENVENH
jgi:hypothetical protein